MFHEIGGLPVHPLAVHAAVVSVPLAALLGILFAVPRTRAWARVPFALVSVGAAAAVFVAKKSGQDFQRTLGLDGGSNPAVALVRTHAGRANVLMILVVVFAVIAVLAFFLSRDPLRFQGLVAGAVCAVVVVVSVVVAFQCYRVGDSGARAVWGNTIAK
jgi:ABC-type branched-subunit amino acid transport system permease subunit